MPTDALENSAAAEALFQSGLILLAEGDFQASAKAFRGAIQANPGYLDAHHGLIRVLGDGLQTEAAVEAAEALIALAPDDPLAHTGLSIALQKAGRVPEAEAAAAKARILEWKRELAAGPQAEGGSLA